MVVDASDTSFTWRCRVCDKAWNDRDVAIRHVNDKRDGDHRAQKPYELIQMDINTDDEQCIESKIEEAFRRIQNGDVDGYGPDITYDEIKYVADAADVEKGHCCRVLDDAGIEYTYEGSPPVRYINQIQGNIKDAIDYLRSHDTDGMTNREMADAAGVQYHTLMNAKSRYQWLLDYDYGESDEGYEGHMETTGVEEALNTLSTKSGSDKTDEESSSEPMIASNTIDTGDNVSKSTAYHMNQDEVFEYLVLLVKHDRLTRARNLFDELT